MPVSLGLQELKFIVVSELDNNEVIVVVIESQAKTVGLLTAITPVSAGLQDDV